MYRKRWVSPIWLKFGTEVRDSINSICTKCQDGASHPLTCTGHQRSNIEVTRFRPNLVETLVIAYSTNIRSISMVHRTLWPARVIKGQIIWPLMTCVGQRMRCTILALGTYAIDAMPDLCAKFQPNRTGPPFPVHLRRCPLSLIRFWSNDLIRFHDRSRVDAVQRWK